MSKQSTTDRKIAAAQQAARDAEHSARASHAFYNFFRCHWREGLLSNDANKQLLESWLDANLLDCSDPANLEIAYLAVGSKMARTATPTPPTPPKPPAAPTPAVTEDQQLRALMKEFKNDPTALKNALRARLKVADVRAAGTSRRQLPTEYDRKRLLCMSGAEMRDLKNRFGFDAINARLAETATK